MAPALFFCDLLRETIAPALFFCELLRESLWLFSDSRCHMVKIAHTLLLLRLLDAGRPTQPHGRPDVLIPVLSHQNSLVQKGVRALGPER